MELIIDRVSRQYKNKIAVDRISLKLHRGVHGLLGANGAGKSTLLLHAAGLLLPTSGEVIVGGIKSTRRTMPQIRRAAGLVFQNADASCSCPRSRRMSLSALPTCV